MRVLVFGDRDWTDGQFLFEALDEINREVKITLVIEGEARGADKLGRAWAESRGVEFLPFPAKWDTYGRAAGPIRNTQMLVEGRPDLGVGFHDSLETSKGTKNMKGQLDKAGVPVIMKHHALNDPRWVEQQEQHKIDAEKWRSWNELVNRKRT